jgi:C4-dicarboxylate transporter/malic acid transport protein
MVHKSPLQSPWLTSTAHSNRCWNTVPYRFQGLHTIGVVVMLLNITLYICTWAMLITRFTLYPWTFRLSFTHPTESLFAPAFVVSFGTILINIVQYRSDSVGPWLTHVVLVLYWIDCGLAIALSITIYLVLWSTQTFTIARMTPSWIFPAYPLLIIGPHAANLAQKSLSHAAAIRVLVGGFTIQGIGFLVSLTIYSAFVYRLMTQKLPAEPLRPGMFVSVGPSAFTVSGTIGIAEDLQHVIVGSSSPTFMDVPGELAAQILRLVANWMSLWLWGLAWWFFFVSLVSNIDCLRKKHHMPFAMTWFSFIFPQTALTTATFAIAEAFDVGAIRIIGCVMTVLLIIVWFVVVGFMIRAVINKQILWPEKGEDKSEGGFRRRVNEADSEGDAAKLPEKSALGPSESSGSQMSSSSHVPPQSRQERVGDAATRNV